MCRAKTSSKWDCAVIIADGDAFAWMREQGFRYHTMSEVEKRGWEPVMEDIISEARDGPEYLFISPSLRRVKRGRVRTGGTATLSRRWLSDRAELRAHRARVSGRYRYAQERYRREALS